MPLLKEKSQIEIYRQLSLIPTRPKGQLMKWVGNKFRYANEIVSYFPSDFNTFYEPFVGTGAVLATLQPERAVAGDTLKPLIELWSLVKSDPEEVLNHYEENWHAFQNDKKPTYESVRDSFNLSPNALDLLFISRTCYGGVMRFTKEGKISTPIGPHNPISPESFARSLYEWRDRVLGSEFILADYKELISQADKGDLVYCDPPYKDSQTILYGAQSFNLDELYESITDAKQRGAKIALSIDGVKKSGDKNIELGIPEGLFEKEVFIDCGHSMLRRFQKNGETMTGEQVKDRLLLTW